jgi:tRNA-dihydrouridine synthase B
MISIGPHMLSNHLALAPMAGVTDLPFRKLCRQLGAGYVVGEMLAANPSLRHTRRSQLRIDHDGEAEPVAVQIAGSEPEWMADAACYNVQKGAQVIDINMGCPSKKVCKRQAGSALLGNLELIDRILRSVIEAVDVPVTLKIRTGLNRQEINGVEVARLAEECGISALAVHGRTRADRFKGQAEYATIREICDAVEIPVFANGDILHVSQARDIIDQTGAQGLMIGRGAQGNPWIFREVIHFLETGTELAPPTMQEVHRVLYDHVRALHRFYGEHQGLRVARKHIGWYLQNRPGDAGLKHKLMRTESASGQLDQIDAHFNRLASIAA